jgi:hypothetical protein
MPVITDIYDVNIEKRQIFIIVCPNVLQLNFLLPENMNIQHVARLLRIANGDIPAVEYRLQELEREEDSLKFRNKDAARIYQQFIDQISRVYTHLLSVFDSILVML